MNKKQQTLNPEAAVEMVIKMQDRQTNAIEILSGLILQFEQINYVLHTLYRVNMIIPVILTHCNI